jgi:hypothetical protein
MVFIISPNKLIQNKNYVFYVSIFMFWGRRREEKKLNTTAASLKANLL